jgi:hypothetical protein
LLAAATFSGTLVAELSPFHFRSRVVPRLLTSPSIFCSLALCVIAAAAGMGAAASEAHGQIVPVSRLGTITRYGSSAPVVGTYTAWESGTVGDNQSRQVLALTPGSITANCFATGTFVNVGAGVLVHATSTVTLTFDILSPATFTLSGTADWFFSHGSVVLSREGGASLFTYTIPSDLHGPASFSASGALAPGRYVLSVSSVGVPVDPGTNVSLSATLNVVPAPSAALALASGATVLARRRRRG